MRGKRVGQRPHLPPAHGIWLARDAKWSGTRQANAAGVHVAVDDRVCLIRALRTLVNTLAEQGHDPRGIAPGVIKQGKRGSIQPAFGSDFGQAGSVTTHMAQQAAEQCHVRAGAQCNMLVGPLTRSCPAWVHHHDPQSGPDSAGGQQPLVQYRVAPGEVATDQDHQIGQFEILINARNQVLAKTTLMSRNRTGHA